MGNVLESEHKELTFWLYYVEVCVVSVPLPPNVVNMLFLLVYSLKDTTT